MIYKIKIKKVSEYAAQPPLYATPGSAAADLCAALPAPLVIKPMERVLIPTGYAFDLPDGDVAGFIFARSGLSHKKGLALANGTGVIDSDYKGEIKVSTINLSKEEITVMPGERIAQFCLMPICKCEFELCESLSESERGAGGFGSTGE